MDIKAVGAKLDQSRVIASISGIGIGLAAGGLTILTARHLPSEAIYLTNLGAVYVLRYISSIVYSLMVKSLWKQISEGKATAGFNWTTAKTDRGLDEHALATDHRFIDAWTAAAVASLAAAAIVVTEPKGLPWMNQWWSILAGTTIIGAMTMESLLFFTPMWFYVKILKRLPERRNDCVTSDS